MSFGELAMTGLKVVEGRSLKLGCVKALRSQTVSSWYLHPGRYLMTDPMIRLIDRGGVKGEGRML